MPERSDHFTHTEVSSGNQEMGRFFGLKACLNTVIEKRKIPTPPGIETRMCSVTILLHD
jgi:hypothetical protein